MNPLCTRVLDALGEPLSPELAEHARGCAACQEVLEGFEGLGVPPSPRPALPLPSLEAVRASALRELAAHPRAIPWTREAWRLLGLFAGVGALGVGVFAWKGQLLNASPLPVVLAIALLLVGGMGGALWLALAPGRRLGWAGVGATAVGMALVVVLGGSGLVANKSFLVGCLPCMRTGTFFSLLPLVTILEALRRVAFHLVRALAAGLAAGLVGLLVLHLHCPDGSPEHLALAHVAPWLLLGALAPWLRARLRTTQHAP